MQRRIPARHKLVLSIAVLVTALGVRLAHWQDADAASQPSAGMLNVLVRSYLGEANRVLGRDSGNELSERGGPSDARAILHPPAYSLLIAAIQLVRETDDAPRSTLRWLQILADSLAVAMLFLIGTHLLPVPAAASGAMLAALSPHLGYYSLAFSPDSLAVVPIVAAVYFLAQASSRPGVLGFVITGALIGFSCWFRSNALFLPLFVAGAASILVPKGRARNAALVVLGAALVILPITIKNWITHHAFVPLSIGSGITLIEGIADYDQEGRFGMPADDRQAAIKDAEWHQRPDYRRNLWVPDGIERDRYRVNRGLEVIRANPRWFLTVMARRAGFMLRYNDSGPARWPLGTSQVPLVSPYPPFGHGEIAVETLSPTESWNSADLIERGALGPDAEVTRSADGQSVTITSNNDEFGDQFVSAPLSIAPNMDYVLVLDGVVEAGRLAVMIGTADRRVTLASTILEAQRASDPGRMRPGRVQPEQGGHRVEPRESDGPTPREIRLSFSSGRHKQVRLLVRTEGRPSVRSVLSLGSIKLFALGATPGRWTGLPRSLVNLIQKNLYRTGRMLLLIGFGAAALAFRRRWRVLLVLTTVPLYYLVMQSPLHTEYRYILPIHYWLFLLAGFGLYSIWLSARWMASATLRRIRSPESAKGRRSESGIGTIS